MGVFRSPSRFGSSPRSLMISATWSRNSRRASVAFSVMGSLIIGVRPFKSRQDQDRFGPLFLLKSKRPRAEARGRFPFPVCCAPRAVCLFDVPHLSREQQLPEVALALL